jgi:hypothetical protein
MQIAQMTKQEKVTLDFSSQFPDTPPEEATLNVTFDPSKMTAARSNEIEAKGDSLEVLVDAVLDLVSEWDLMDGKKVVPLTHASLMNTPSIVLGLVLSGVSEQVAKKAEAEGKA